MNTEKPYVIVVGIDYSATSETALEEALRLGASRQQAEVHAVNVMTPLPPAAWYGYALPSAALGMSFNDALKLLDQHLTEKVAAAVASMDASAASHLPRILRHLRVGMPAEEIAQVGADLEADLLIVGTHGRRGASRVILGSVAEGVVRLAPCPVLVVRPKRIVAAPTIERPCPGCVLTRRETNGARMWCAQHSERHGQRHTYHQGDRVSGDGTMPLLFHV